MLREILLTMMMTPSQVRKENPDASIGEVAKILGKMWGEIDPSDKAKFDKVTKLPLGKAKSDHILNCQIQRFCQIKKLNICPSYTQKW